MASHSKSLSCLGSCGSLHFIHVYVFWTTRLQVVVLSCNRPTDTLCSLPSSSSLVRTRARHKNKDQGSACSEHWIFVHDFGVLPRAGQGRTAWGLGCLGWLGRTRNSWVICLFYPFMSFDIRRRVECWSRFCYSYFIFDPSSSSFEPSKGNIEKSVLLWNSPRNRLIYAFYWNFTNEEQISIVKLCGRYRPDISSSPLCSRWIALHGNQWHCFLTPCPDKSKRWISDTGIIGFRIINLVFPYCSRPANARFIGFTDEM